MTWSRLLRVLALVYVVATLVHVGWVMAHEPFAFDAWNMADDTKAQPFSLGRFVDYWSHEYTHSNPRIGQAFTYLAYKLEYFSVIATPLAFLALSTGILVLGLGRWPRRGRELALAVIVIGFSWLVFPQLGKTLFNRAYGANYVYAAAIQTWFLVLLRLGAGRRVLLYALAGFVAGLCNEHTGPTLCLFLVIYAWRTRAKHVYAATAGAILGFAALFFAPGQGERYDSLAQKTGLLGKLLSRGLTGNLDILRSLLLGAAPLLALIVIVVLAGKRASTSREAAEGDGQRRGDAVRLIGVAMVACVLVATTMFVSPKLGPRFFIMPLAVLVAGFIALCDVRLTDRQLIPFVVFAVLASGYAALHTLSLYSRVKDQSDARLAALTATRPGSIFTAESFEQVEDSWWFLGDDFRDIRKRQMITRYFALEDVVFRAYDPEAPLGVTDVRLVAHASPVPLPDGLDLGWYKGLDVSTIHDAFAIAVRRLPPQQVELAVHFVGERPELPRAKLLVARFTPPRRMEAYVAKISRKPRARERTIELPAELRRADVEVFMYAVGGEAHRLGTGTDALKYVPWKTGVYWVLACTAGECFVTTSVRQSG